MSIPVPSYARSIRAEGNITEEERVCWETRWKLWFPA